MEIYISGNIFMPHGINVAFLYKLDENKKELDIFNIIFDNMLWENIVTETNRYAGQIINNKTKR